jgi:hypothetical protein
MKPSHLISRKEHWYVHSEFFIGTKLKQTCQAHFLGISTDPSVKAAELEEFRLKYPNVQFIFRERKYNSHIKGTSVLKDHVDQDTPAKWTKAGKQPKVHICNEETGFKVVQATESALFYSHDSKGI